MIVLLRHAETRGAKGRCIGRTEVPLSEAGLTQVRRLADTLRGAGFVRLCSSPSGRALATMEPLAHVLEKRVDVLPGLDEINMGEWDGLEFAEIKQRFPEQYAERGAHFATFRPPGGESFTDVADRAMTVLAGLAEGQEPVLACTHAGLIRVVLCRLTGHSLDDPFHFAPGYARLTVLEPSGAGFALLTQDIAPADLLSLL